MDSYAFNDITCADAQLYDMFIDRKPYNELGERHVDYSPCGVERVVDTDRTVHIPHGATQAKIQAAIDSAESPSKITFSAGTYIFASSLVVKKSGIILLGEGEVNFRAVKGTNFPLILIEGESIVKQKPVSPVLDTIVPVGTNELRIPRDSKIKEGDWVLITWAANDLWISELGMHQITSYPQCPARVQNWTCDAYVFNFERKVVRISPGPNSDEQLIVLDQPLTATLNSRHGTTTIQRFTDRRISDVQVRNLTLISEYDESKFTMINGEKEFTDEDHPMTGIEVINASNVLVSNVQSHGFDVLVHFNRSAKHCTASDCQYFRPSSLVVGGRRYSFYVDGQYNLVIDCVAERGRHSFVSGSRNEGPNAFVDCVAKMTYAMSEPHHRHSMSGLYDNVDDCVAIENRLYFGTGHGITAGHYLVWNPPKPVICQKTPLCENFCVGGSHREPGNKLITRYGYFFPSGTFVNFGKPLPFRSLYHEQRKFALAKGSPSSL